MGPRGQELQAGQGGASPAAQQLHPPPQQLKSSLAPCLIHTPSLPTPATWVGAPPAWGEKGLPLALGKGPVTGTLGQGQGWAVPQRLLDNGPKHWHLGDILRTGKPVRRHNSFQLLVQGLLDARVPGEVVQRPGQRVGGLGEQSAKGSEGVGAGT